MNLDTKTNSAPSLPSKPDKAILCAAVLRNSWIHFSSIEQQYASLERDPNNWFNSMWIAFGRDFPAIVYSHGDDIEAIHQECLASMHKWIPATLQDVNTLSAENVQGYVTAWNRFRSGK